MNIGKETNNLEWFLVIGTADDDSLENDNTREFYDGIISLKSKDVKDMRIFERKLRKSKSLRLDQGKFLIH